MLSPIPGKEGIVWEIRPAFHKALIFIWEKYFSPDVKPAGFASVKGLFKMIQTVLLGANASPQVQRSPAIGAAPQRRLLQQKSSGRQVLEFLPRAGEMIAHPAVGRQHNGRSRNGSVFHLSIKYLRICRQVI